MRLHRAVLFGCSFLLLALGGSKPTETPTNEHLPTFDRISLKIAVKRDKNTYRLRTAGQLNFLVTSPVQGEIASVCELPVVLEYLGDKNDFDKKASSKMDRIAKQMGLEHSSAQEFSSDLFFLKEGKFAEEFAGRLDDLLTRYELTPVLLEKTGEVIFAKTEKGFAFKLPLDTKLESQMSIIISLRPTDDAGTSALCQQIIGKGWRRAKPTPG
ncbi:MAG: hypothetical protein H6617_00845 [Bdellovibrionaceae bacterium]|nr:hypothetical protein [Pseudobdellovibrionaceae bacterium]